MKLGDKVKVRAVLKKNSKYFNADAFSAFNCTNNINKKDFFENRNLYSYEDHYSLIEEGEDLIKDVYERKYVEKQGYLVGKRRIAIRRTYMFQVGSRWPEGPDEERIETKAEETTVYLVALNMNHIARVLEEDIEVIK